MKTYQYILTAAALVLGLAGCSEDALVQQPNAQEPTVDVTIGANFAQTRTTMDSEGNVLWSASDKIKVQIGSNSYDFELKSGSGSTSAVFHAVVTADDAAILAGTATGTVTAYYPTSGAEVPATQTYAEGTFADGMNPMTATYSSGLLTFTNNAAVVRVQGVSATATKAVLSYTVNSQNYSVSMALTAGETAKNLYFVVVPGAQDFNFALDGGAADKYSASAATSAGARYNLEKYVEAKIGDVEYGTFAAAMAAVKDNDVVTLMKDIALTSTMNLNVAANYSLDLNDKTITCTTNAFQVLAGQLTVIGNGTIDTNGSDTNYSFRVATNGKLVIGAENQNYDIKINDLVESTTETTIWGGTISKVCCYASFEGTSSNVTINGGKFKHLDNVGFWSEDCPTTFYLNGGTFNTFENVPETAKSYCKYVIKSGYEIGENTDEATKTDYPWALVETVATAATETELKNAISSAQSGDVIKLTANITLTSYLEINKALTIDLNGKTFSTGSMTGNENPATGYRPIRIGATVSIKDGSINGPSMEWGNSLLCVMDNGNLTLSNVSMNTPGICATSRTSTSVITIESGTYTSTGSTTSADCFVYCTPIGVMNGAKVNIKGGTFTGKYYAASIYSSGGTINITGGTFNKGATQTAANEGNLAYALMNDGNNTTEKKGTITISGNPTIHGSFRGRFNNQAGHYGYLNISGGTFDSDCELFNFNQSYITLSGYTITPNGECPDKGYSKTTGNGKRWTLTKNN